MALWQRPAKTLHLPPARPNKFREGTIYRGIKTIGCGNDNLMGKGTAPVPEPTTILLSGLGLLGMGLFLRRKQTQKLARQTA